MSKIEWTEFSWNPIVGCTKCSPGCENCYAERIVHRFKMNINTPQYLGKTDDNGNWTGRIECCDWMLGYPLKWRKPRKIFVCSMSDLFHPRVSNDFIGNIFDVIRKTPKHTYQILTKRVDRMADVANKLIRDHGAEHFKHVWWGCSISTQPEANKNIPLLLQIRNAVVRYISIEPLLEGISLAKTTGLYGESLDWIIVGGESKGRGPGRECKLEWVQSIVNQCKSVNVPVFVKQVHVEGKLYKMPPFFPQEYPRR